MLKYLFTLFSVIALKNAAPVSAQQQGGNSGSSGGSFSAGSINSIESGISGFRFGGGSTVADLFSGDGGLGLNAIVFFLAGFALIIYMVFGGFQILAGAGSPDSAAAGKAKITNGLIGFLIIFTAFWVVQILGSVLGLEGITTTFGG